MEEVKDNLDSEDDEDEDEKPSKNKGKIGMIIFVGMGVVEDARG